jgi:hypothetical protein
VVSFTIPFGCILGFLDRSRYFFFQVAPQLYEAEWTPFQNHCFSENIVVLGIEPGPLDLQIGTLTEAVYFLLHYFNASGTHFC